MNITETKLKDVYLLSPNVFEDTRGWFMETYSKVKMGHLTNVDFVQDNQSYSAKKGTLRGIHFQTSPMAQTKLVRCVKGSVLDLAVDLRKDSPNFKKWILVELSAQNKNQLLIPRGFGHGFVTLEDDTEIVYKVDNYYSKENDKSILWSDSDLNIEWGITNPILSDKDINAPRLKEIELVW